MTSEALTHASKLAKQRHARHRAEDRGRRRRKQVGVEQSA